MDLAETWADAGVAPELSPGVLTHVAPQPGALARDLLRPSAPPPSPPPPPDRGGRRPARGRRWHARHVRDRHGHVRGGPCVGFRDAPGGPLPGGPRTGPADPRHGPGHGAAGDPVPDADPRADADPLPAAWRDPDPDPDPDADADAAAEARPGRCGHRDRPRRGLRLRGAQRLVRPGRGPDGARGARPRRHLRADAARDRRARPRVGVRQR